jgi:hypothetical protein
VRCTVIGSSGCAAKRDMAIPAAETVLEPISPELVLVDPELARTERTRLLERAQVEAAEPPRLRLLPGEAPPPPHAPPARSGQQAAHERFGKRVAQVVLVLSLIMNGVLIAVVVSRGGAEQAAPTPAANEMSTSIPVAPSTRRRPPATKARSHPARGSPAKTTATVTVATTRVVRTPGQPSNTLRSRPRPSAGSTRTSAQSTPRSGTSVTPRSAVPIDTTAEVEQRVLALIVQSPAGKLPPALIDSETGLAKNNLQAVCHRSQLPSGERPAFGCAVRPAQHKPNEGLFVRYQPARNGRDVLTWYRYRSG